MASGLPTGNGGYFGIPVALALLDTTTFGIYLIAGISNTMFQITYGYYILARGSFSWRNALEKLMRLPPLYASILGIIFSISNITIPEILIETSTTLKEAFVVLGMMIIGLTLASFNKIKFDLKFLSLVIFIRFIV